LNFLGEKVEYGVKIREEFAKKNIERILKAINPQKFILYPYGKWGKWAENLIYEKYGLKPYLIIDNQAVDEKANIYPVSKLSDIDCNAVIIITCEKAELCSKLADSVKSIGKDYKTDFMFSKNGLPTEVKEFWIKKAI